MAEMEVKGFGLRDWDMDPMTLVAEFAAVLKKIRIAIRTKILVIPDSGRLSIKSNMTFSPEPSISIPLPSPLRCALIAVAPKMKYHNRDSGVGTKLRMNIVGPVMSTKNRVRQPRSCWHWIGCGFRD